VSTTGSPASCWGERSTKQLLLELGNCVAVNLLDSYGIGDLRTFRSDPDVIVLNVDAILQRTRYELIRDPTADRTA
jgi:hypothetical protein